MIFKIKGSQVAITPNINLIVFSSDGEFALVKSDSNIESAIETYTDDKLDMLLSDQLYRQPCKDC